MENMVGEGEEDIYRELATVNVPKADEDPSTGRRIGSEDAVNAVPGKGDKW